MDPKKEQMLLHFMDELSTRGREPSSQSEPFDSDDEIAEPNYIVDDSFSKRYIDEPLRQENEPPHYQNMHLPDTIPNIKDPQKSHHMRCRHCASQKKRKETKFLCKTCSDKPPVCRVPYFKEYHKPRN